MDNIQKRYGYTGQGLRVNLTTGKITKEPTFPRFKDEIGGTALGYRVFWDEVPPKTQPLDEANKLVIAPGPFSGSGALCSSRTSITTIYPTIYPMPMIASAHIGGDMAARLKQAGYDFIIIEGKSEKPVYLYINNDEVELRDAKGIWGQGTRRAQQMLADQTSPMASIAVIGPAGENLVPMSVLISIPAAVSAPSSDPRNSKASLSSATSRSTFMPTRKNGRRSPNATSICSVL